MAFCVRFVARICRLDCLVSEEASSDRVDATSVDF